MVNLWRLAVLWTKARMVSMPPAASMRFKTMPRKLSPLTASQSSRFKAPCGTSADASICLAASRGWSATPCDRASSCKPSSRISAKSRRLRARSLARSARPCTCASRLLRSCWWAVAIERLAISIMAVRIAGMCCILSCKAACAATWAWSRCAKCSADSRFSTSDRCAW